MLKIDTSGNISITQGDSGTIKQTLWADADKTRLFELAEGQSVEFCIRSVAGGDPVITKETAEQQTDGAVLFYFTSQETASLSRGEYIYDTALVGAEIDKKNTYAGGDYCKRKFLVV